MIKEVSKKMHKKNFVNPAIEKYKEEIEQMREEFYKAKEDLEIAQQDFDYADSELFDTACMNLTAAKIKYDATQTKVKALRDRIAQEEKYGKHD